MSDKLSQARGQVLNLVAAESIRARVTVVQIAAEERPESIIQKLDRLRSLDLPRHHHVALGGIHPNRIIKDSDFHLRVKAHYI